jgi:hypothetical protein
VKKNGGGPFSPPVKAMLQDALGKVRERRKALLDEGDDTEGYDKPSHNGGERGDS